ncbi:MAG: hypothetical protein AAF385_16780, partial [Pseudomonadota bacterium]
MSRRSTRRSASTKTSKSNNAIARRRNFHRLLMEQLEDRRLMATLQDFVLKLEPHENATVDETHVTSPQVFKANANTPAELKVAAPGRTVKQISGENNDLTFLGSTPRSIDVVADSLGTETNVDGNLKVNGLKNLTLGGGNDTVHFKSEGSLSGRLDLKSGNDTLDYSDYGQRVIVNLSTKQTSYQDGAHQLDVLGQSATGISSGV